MFRPFHLTRAALVAAVYVILCIIFQPISYGIVQFRIAEALTLLPILFVEAVPGLFIGCLLANIIGGYGVFDIFGGSLVTLLAAMVTYWYRRSLIAYLSPILFNAFLISIYLTIIVGEAPYYMWVLSIMLGQSVVILFLGVPLLRVLSKALPHLDRSE